MLAMSQPLMRSFHGVPEYAHHHQAPYPTAAAGDAPAAPAPAPDSRQEPPPPPLSNGTPPSTTSPPSQQSPTDSTRQNPTVQVPANDSSYYYHLEIVQQPIQARAMGWGPKADSRRPVDPPPVINFQVRDQYNEPVTHDLTNNFILHTSLCEADGSESSATNLSSGTGRDSAVPARLTGTTMVSLTHIRTPAPGKFFFLLHDLSIRQEGRYQLVFNVYEVMPDQNCIKHRAQMKSTPITVYSPKTFPGLETSSDLIKEIASQGCRVRVRKESTFKRKKSTKKNVGNLPPSVANNLVDSLSLQQAFGPNGQQQLPQAPQTQQQQPQQQPMHYHHPNAMYAPPPPNVQYQFYGHMEHGYDPNQQHLQPPVEYQHGYTLDDYRATPMSSSSSSASNLSSGQQHHNQIPQPSSSAYFRGYEALLTAAAHQQQQQQHQQQQQQQQPHTDYQALPPTPANRFERERMNSTSAAPAQSQPQQTDPQQRNHRSQSYPMPEMYNAPNVRPPSPPEPQYDVNKAPASQDSSAYGYYAGQYFDGNGGNSVSDGEQFGFMQRDEPQAQTGDHGA